MGIETPQEGLNEEQKEAALRRAKLFKVRSRIQLAYMREQGFELTGNNAKDAEIIHAWDESQTRDDFNEAFERAAEEHPDLPEIYESNREEALRIIRETVEHLHQPA